MQPSYEITHHPIDLSRHGLNPYGDSMYRVVWADSRKTKVICRGKVHILPRYQHGDESAATGHWVLEKWAPPAVLVKMTREQWEAMLAAIPNAAMEEYPEKGDWELSRVFNEADGPFCSRIDEVALHAQLQFHEWRFVNQSNAERKQQIEAVEDAKETVANEEFDALYEVAREETQWLM